MSDSGTGLDASKRTLSNNLRQLTAKRGTIGRVCSHTGITRTQFHRYLSGQTVPRPARLEQIAAFFGVTVSDLLDEDFCSPFAPRSQLSDITKHHSARIFLDNLKNEYKGYFCPGFYIIYLYSPKFGGLVIRSIMEVSDIGGTAAYRRFTGVDEEKREDWLFAKSCHRGVVIESSDAITLLETERSSRTIPAKILLTQRRFGRGILCGATVMLSHSSIEFLQVVVDRLEQPVNARSIKRLSRSIYLNSPNMDMEIKQILTKNIENI